MRKSYKALRVMEAHKQAEPRFARNLQLLNTHILKAAGDSNDVTIDSGTNRFPSSDANQPFISDSE